MINIVSINNINKPIFNKNNFEKSYLNSTKQDNISFKGDISRVIVTGNPLYTKSLMMIQINNSSKKAKSIFSKIMLKVFKFFTAISRPDEVLSGTDTFLSVKNNIINGGIIAQKQPFDSKMKILMLAQDKVNQTPKERLKSLYQLCDAIYKKCKADNIGTICWEASSKDKKAVNLFDKIVKSSTYFRSNGKSVDFNNPVLYYNVSTNRFKEFLNETLKKYPKIFS